MANGGPLYTIDPISGETTATFADGTVSESTASEALGQPVNVSQGTIYDAATGRIIGNLGQQDVATSYQLSSGHRSIGSVVQSGSINGPTSGTFLGQPAQIQRMVGGSITVVDQLGDTHVFEVGGSSPTDYGAFLAPFGRQRGFYLDADGVEHPVGLAGSYNSTAEVQAALGPAFRLGTVRESVDVALRYWLAENGRGLLSDIMRAGGVAGVPGTDNISGLVNYLAQMPTLDQLTFTNNYLLPPVEGA